MRAKRTDEFTAVAAPSRSSRRRVEEEEEEEEDEIVAVRQQPEDESEEEEAPASSKKKKRAPPASSGSKRSRRSAADEEEEEDAIEEIVERRNRKAAAARTSLPSDAKPMYSSTEVLKVELELAQEENKGELKKICAPASAPNYVSNSKMNSAAAQLSLEDRRQLVSSVTRLVLAYQLHEKPLTADDIIRQLMQNVAQISNKRDFPKLVLGYVRVEVAKCLKDVFGFELFAGKEGSIAVTDTWHIVNSLENDALRRIIDEGKENGDSQDDEESEKATNHNQETDTLRGATMVVLAVLLMRRGEIAEDDLQLELVKFGMANKTVTELRKLSSTKHLVSIPDILGKLRKQGFIISRKQDLKTVYCLGEHAINELGKRSILQFIKQSSGMNLDVNDEKALLSL